MTYISQNWRSLLPLLGEALGVGGGLGLHQQPRPAVLQLEQEAVGVLLEVVRPRFYEEASLDPPLEDDCVQVDGLSVLPPKQSRPRAMAEVVWLGARGPEVSVSILHFKSTFTVLGKVPTSDAFMLNS